MINKIAIIDLGTNTCNLLIAEYGDKTYQIIYQGKEVVKLGKEGIDKNMLTEDALQRAVVAVSKHQEKILNFDVSDVIILGTSAIREARNKEWFQNELRQKTGLNLLVISGVKEADLIFKGVKLAFGNIEDHSVILDIGGGSNEFILTENDEPIWKQSFSLGMARAIEQIPLSDPIIPAETDRVRHYFESGLESLWNRTKNSEINTLIGCSGAFDTLADMIDETDPGTKTRIRQEIKTSDFNRIYKLLINSTTIERLKMKGLETLRVEMIVPSVILISLTIEKLKIQKIYQTDFALREGVLYERIFS